MTIREASAWASVYTGKNMTPSNITYLIQYGKISSDKRGGGVYVSKRELQAYYKTRVMGKKERWEKQLDEKLNWRLSFSEYKEAETTKHVHRLHPYKGKFIPQLVEYFLSGKTDSFKRRHYFNSGDVLLDPFCGSGTTMVQANELSMHCVGVDVSEFNAFIANVKVGKYDSHEIKTSADVITHGIVDFQRKKNNVLFESRLSEELKIFNQTFFPSPEFKRKAVNGEINETAYGGQKAAEFLKRYYQMIKEYGITLDENKRGAFLDEWFMPSVRDEIEFAFGCIKSMKNTAGKKLLALALSRTVRSCRATTHADLGTLIKPVKTVYYCKKHGKICKPLFSILNWWQRYADDAVRRTAEYDRIRTDTMQICLTGDSRNIDIIEALKEKNDVFAGLVAAKKVAGIFSSPPYVGLIDYHEQHAYAYDLFGFGRRDNLEIGPLCKGQGRQAQESYVCGIANVLNNCKRFLKEDYNVFLVANDKNCLYPKIAELCDMKIVEEHKRPVLNRVEKNRSAYAESIFHLKKK